MEEQNFQDVQDSTKRMFADIQQMAENILVKECPQYIMIIDEVIKRADLSEKEEEYFADAMVFILSLGQLEGSFGQPQFIQGRFCSKYFDDITDNPVFELLLKIERERRQSSNE